MKRLTVVALLLCLSGWTWGQIGGGIPSPDMSGHPQTAVTKTLPTGGSVVVDSGSRPASDFSQRREEKSLGAVARENRESHKKEGRLYQLTVDIFEKVWYSDYMKTEELSVKVARLPNWAQEHIRHLTRQVENSTSERDIAYKAINGGEPSSTRIERHEKPAMFLPDREVTFVLDDKQEIGVTFVREHRTERKIGVRVRTNWRQMSIAPECANVVSIHIKER